MLYTVTSRGRPIGRTDLGFAHGGGPIRIGWFHPNSDGERLMPVATSVTVAERTYAWRPELPDASPHVTEQRDAALLADVAEAVQHADALVLEIRRDDGSVVPAEAISIQDVDELVAWSEQVDAVRDGESWKYGDTVPDLPRDPMDDAFDEALEGADELELPFEPRGDELIFGDGFADAVGPWTPDEDEPDPLMRYQIIVTLLDAAAVP